MADLRPASDRVRAELDKLVPRSDWARAVIDDPEASDNNAVALAAHRIRLEDEQRTKLLPAAYALATAVEIVDAHEAIVKNFYVTEQGEQ